MNIQEACLNRYPSPQSRRRIGYELNRLAQLFQIASVNDIDWPKFTRATIGAWGGARNLDLKVQAL